MLIDTGAQISIINKNSIQDQSKINTRNKITISSIHGSERTLGEIDAKISKEDKTIPIQLQVTKNTFLNEDGILGYDMIGENAIIDGPNRTITINSRETQLAFPIRRHSDNNAFVNLLFNEIKKFQKIEYLKNNEINPQYEINLRRVQSITQEINLTKIKINPINNE